MVKSQCIECGEEIENPTRVMWCSIKCKEDFHKRYYSNSAWCKLHSSSRLTKAERLKAIEGMKELLKK